MWLRLRRRIAHEFGMCPREKANHNCYRFPERCMWPTSTPVSRKEARHYGHN